MDCYNHHLRKLPVVAVNTDGTMMGYFERINDAAGKYGFKRHGISRAARSGKIYRGIKWMHEKDYRNYYELNRTDELAYTLTKYQHVGVPASHPRKPFAEYSEDGKRRIRESARRTMIRLHAEDRIRHHVKPVFCITNGIHYDSVKAAAAALGLKPNCISDSITRHLNVHGYRFMKEKTDKNNKK